jgi:hypothetical protein
VTQIGNSTPPLYSRLQINGSEPVMVGEVDEVDGFTSPLFHPYARALREFSGKGILDEK